MTKTKEILLDNLHRPWPLPQGIWEYYQEWNDVLFLHWEIPFDNLRELVPKQLNIDSFERKYYVSLVAFTMQKIRPKNLPSLKFVSDFHEINIRTYIDHNNKKGVYFLNIEAQKTISALVAKKISGLPYEKADIIRKEGYYSSRNFKKKFKIDAKFSIKDNLSQKTELDKWLTERYCLYLDKNNVTYRYDIHHKEWEIKNVHIDDLSLDYKIGNVTLSTDNLLLSHYSNGVKVLSWPKQKVEHQYGT